MKRINLLLVMFCAMAAACVEADDGAIGDDGEPGAPGEATARQTPAASAPTPSSCGADDVAICHVPPGNPNQAHLIVVGRPAVAAHLAHGDNLGACAPVPVFQCVPQSVASCYSGPSGTMGVGVCRAGTRTCDTSGSRYLDCTGEVRPGAEICGNLRDDDCDGNTDEGCGHGAEQCGDHLDNDGDGLIDERCVGDLAWDDADRDGHQDAGEAGIPGATFVLHTAAGATVGTAVSDATGRYQFADVQPGMYYLEVAPPTGYSVTATNEGADDLDSDFDGEELRTATFVVTGAADTSRDCGVAPDQHGLQ